MEQATRPDPEDTAGERRLRELFNAAATDYVDDAGFTSRVLGRLPVARRSRSQRRLILLGGAVLLGCALAQLLAGPALPKFGAELWILLRQWSGLSLTFAGVTLDVASLVLLTAGAGIGGWAATRVK